MRKIRLLLTKVTDKVVMVNGLGFLDTSYHIPFPFARNDEWDDGTDVYDVKRIDINQVPVVPYTQMQTYWVELEIKDNNELHPQFIPEVAVAELSLFGPAYQDIYGDNVILKQL